MSGYNFTESVRKVLTMARDEANGLSHEYIGTEHILLGLMREGEGMAAAVLRNLSVNLGEIQQSIDNTVIRGKADARARSDLPYTSRAKKVLELAMAEARDLAHDYVGTEHLLLGLLREERGIAAQTLHAAGLTEEIARAEVNRLIGLGGALTRPASTARVVAVIVEVRFANGSVLRKDFQSVAAAIGFLSRQ